MIILNGISGTIRFRVGCRHCRSNVSPSDKYCKQCGRQLVEMPVGETQNGEWILYPKDIKELLKRLGETK